MRFRVVLANRVRRNDLVMRRSCGLLPGQELLVVDYASRSRAGSAAPENEELEPVLRYLGGPGGDGEDRQYRGPDRHFPHGEELPRPVRWLGRWLGAGPSCGLGRWPDH